MLENNRQTISDVENSSIQQAQGDIHNTYILTGGTPLEDIIRNVVRSELDIVTKEAYEKFNQLIEEFQNRLADEISKLKNPQDIIDRFKEPKFQFILHDIIKEFTQANDETLKEDLIDILIDRLKVNEDSVLQFIIENAIQILPKISMSMSQLLAAMYLRFLKERCSANLLRAKLNSYAIIYEHLDKITNLDIEYLKQLNCLSALPDLKHMEPIETEMRVKYDLFFRKPISIESFSSYATSNEVLKMANDVFSYCCADEIQTNQYRCSFISSESLKDYFDKSGKTNEYNAVHAIFNKTPTLSDGEIRQELISINPNWEKAINLFHKEQVWYYQPTPVGMYIAKKVLKRTNIRLGKFELENLF